MSRIIVLWVQTMRVVDCSVQHYRVMGSDPNQVNILHTLFVATA